MKVMDCKKVGIVDRKYTRGYVSRVDFDPNKQELHEAGGNRKGQLYYLAPNYASSRYCFRVYVEVVK